MQNGILSNWITRKTADCKLDLAKISFAFGFDMYEILQMLQHTQGPKLDEKELTFVGCGRGTLGMLQTLQLITLKCISVNRSRTPVDLKKGAMTFSIMTLNKKGLFGTPSLNDIQLK